MNIKREMKKLLQAMDFVEERANKSSKDSKMFLLIYQLLGDHAWQEICTHKFDFNTRKKLVICKLCGTVKIPYTLKHK